MPVSRGFKYVEDIFYDLETNSFIFPRFGFNKWRDPMRPTQVLAKLCKDEGLDGPHYSTGRVRIDNKVFGASSQVLEESGMCNHFCY